MSKPVILNLVSMILLFTVNTLVLQPRAAVSDSPKPNCKTSCGKVSIPYPFGMGNSSCYFDEWYQIDCLNLSGNYTPFLRLTNVEVLEISISEGTVTVENPITFSSCDDKVYREAANLTGSSFVYSQKRNRFTAVSCNKLAYMNSAGDQSSSYSRNSASQTNVILAACMSICDKNTTDGSCNGMNCCQTTIPSNLMVFSTDLNPDTYNRHERCRYAFLVDQKWFELRSKSYLDIPSKMDSVPVVLEWNLLYNNLGEQVFGKFPDQMDKPKRFNSTSYCQRDNTTTSIFNYTRIQCYCDRGFEGNPYLLHGCQDINECENPPDDCKDHTCVNTHGGYTCQKKERIDPTTQRMLQGIGIGSGLLFLLLVLWFLYKIMKKRRKIKRKKKFFKRNGGLLLQQQLCSSEVNVETIKLFNSKELEKATDRFHVDRILGQGGQGTVYKGMLTDGRIVAVKRSKIVDESKIVEFINEVVILSQVNHRNVVKLLGCCLETEVPLLVYEFIPNGTLSQYIHDHNDEFPFTWEIRLRIAIEIAGALSYLHSSASFPIYHRDIKSTNILLDEKYRAKIADFGTSRSVSIDQTHLTTLVHGTLGYLDPEYFQSSQFTEKSDVYSFGVVLVELLTGQKAISINRSEEAGKSLATYFILSMQENRLFDILGGHVLKGPREDIMVVANLAKRCLNLNGRKRPTMKEITVELEGIQMLAKTVTTSSSVPQNYEEVECLRTHVTEPWDVVSLSTGPAFDTGPHSSLQELPLLHYTA